MKIFEMKNQAAGHGANCLRRQWLIKSRWVKIEYEIDTDMQDKQSDLANDK